MNLKINKAILLERYQGENGDYLTLGVEGTGQIKITDKEGLLAELPIYVQVSLDLEVTGRI